MKHPLSNLPSRARRAALIAVLGLAGSATLALAQTGQFIPLGDLFTGTNANFNSSANGIAIGGNTVAGSGSLDGLSGGSVFEAFRWPGSGSIISIGDLSGGITNAAALGVSGDGSIIVGYGHDNLTVAQQKPFSWTSGGGFVTLGTLSGGLFGTAQGISSN
ncbi:MAG: hypothetical protein HY301_09020, partial [Verrucomicrobia bacterium]|nr:hypothetical protein [Verrucomicrobiota bacterium]